MRKGNIADPPACDLETPEPGLLWARLACALLLHLPLWSLIWTHCISQEILECAFVSLETKNHYKPGVVMYTFNSSIYKAAAD